MNVLHFMRAAARAAAKPGAGVRVFYSAPTWSAQGTKASRGLQVWGRRAVAPVMFRVGTPLLRDQARGMASSAVTPARQLGRRSAFYYGLMGAAGGVALLALFADGKHPAHRRAENAYSDVVRSRINATYGYFASSVAITSIAAAAMFRSGLAARMLAVHPMLLMGGSLVATIGTMIVTTSIDYYNSPLAKHAAYVAFNTSVAASLAPLGYMGGPLVLKAAVITGCIVGSLGVMGLAAPSEQWLSMRGPLSIGLGVVIAGSLGQLLFPASSLLYNLSLYGGLAVFGGFVLYDTAKIRKAAQVEQRYDPINHQLGVYMDSVNIFVRIVQILSGGQQRR